MGRVLCNEGVELSAIVDSVSGFEGPRHNICTKHISTGVWWFLAIRCFSSLIRQLGVEKEDGS